MKVLQAAVGLIHVHLSASMDAELRELARRTRIPKSVLIRESVSDLLAKYSAPDAPGIEGTEPEDLDADMVCRLELPQVAALRELSRRTRIRQAEFMREAFADLLMKHKKKRGAA